MPGRLRCCLLPAPPHSLHCCTVSGVLPSSVAGEVADWVSCAFERRHRGPPAPQSTSLITLSKKNQSFKPSLGTYRTAAPAGGRVRLNVLSLVVFTACACLVVEDDVSGGAFRRSRQACSAGPMACGGVTAACILACATNQDQLVALCACIRYAGHMLPAPLGTPLPCAVRRWAAGGWDPC